MPLQNIFHINADLLKENERFWRKFPEIFFWKKFSFLKYLTDFMDKKKNLDLVLIHRAGDEVKRIHVCAYCIYSIYYPPTNLISTITSHVNSQLHNDL